LTNTDSTNFTYTFDNGILSKYSLAVGDLLVSSVGNGILRENETITQNVDNIAGGKMKEAGTTHRFYPNSGATSSSGLSALPGGCLNGIGQFTTNT